MPSNTVPINWAYYIVSVGGRRSQSRVSQTALKWNVVAKTSSMVRKEIWTHLLAYTLLRTVVWRATVKRLPFHLSCHCTRWIKCGIAGSSRETPSAATIPNPVEQVANNLLPTIRPHRWTRGRETQAKPFSRMQQPRSILKAKLAAWLRLFSDSEP